ncbi:MAG: RNA polymerase sigma factor [Candidatus Nanopelagicales bacterium]
MGESTESTGRTDAELLSQVAGGDTGALRQLYERHAPWVSVRLTRRCNDPEAVADVLQDTFVGVWKGASAYRGDGEVAGWVWGIAIRRLVSRLRRVAGSAEFPFADVEVGIEPGVEERLLAGVEYGGLGSALATLSPEMRAVVQAVVLDGLTTKETARLLRVPENTVKSRLHRAKAHLRSQLMEGLA